MRKQKISVGKNKSSAKKLFGKLEKWKASSDELERFVDKEFDLLVK